LKSASDKEKADYFIKRSKLTEEQMNWNAESERIFESVRQKYKLENREAAGGKDGGQQRQVNWSVLGIAPFLFDFLNKYKNFKYRCTFCLFFGNPADIEELLDSYMMGNALNDQQYKFIANTSTLINSRKNRLFF